MLATVDPGAARRASRSRSGRRRRRRCEPRPPRPGWTAADAAGEPGGVLPRGRRLPGVPRSPGRSPTSPGRSSTRTARSSGGTTGLWRYTPGQRRGIGVASPEPLYALRSDVDANTLVVGPRRRSVRRRVEARGRLYVAVDDVEAKLRYRSSPVGARVSATDGRLLARARRAGRGGRTGSGRRPLRRRRGRRCGRDRARDGVGSRAMTVAFSAGDAAYWGLAIFLVLLGVGSIFALFKLGQLFDRISSLVQGTERDALAGRRQDGWHGRPRQLPARQARHRDGQRRVDGGQRRHRGARGLDGDHDARREGLRLRRRHRARRLVVPQDDEASRRRRMRRRTRRVVASRTWPRTCASPGARRRPRSGRRRRRPRRRSRSRTRGRSRRRRRSPIRRPCRPTSSPSVASRSGDSPSMLGHRATSAGRTQAVVSVLFVR